MLVPCDRCRRHIRAGACPFCAPRAGRALFFAPAIALTLLSGEAQAQEAGTDAEPDVGEEAGVVAPDHDRYVQPIYGAPVAPRGCGGCAVSTEASEPGVALGAAALLAAFSRRRKRS